MCFFFLTFIYRSLALQAIRTENFKFKFHFNTYNSGFFSIADIYCSKNQYIRVLINYNRYFPCSFVYCKKYRFLAASGESNKLKSNVHSTVSKGKNCFIFISRKLRHPGETCSWSLSLVASGHCISLPHTLTHTHTRQKRGAWVVIG